MLCFSIHRRTAYHVRRWFHVCFLMALLIIGGRLSNPAFAEDTPRDPLLRAVLETPDGYRNLPPPKLGDWRMEHPEKEQSLAAFRALNPAKPKPGQQVALLPLFLPSPSQRILLEQTQEYLHLFFQMPVSLSPYEPLRLPPSYSAKRQADRGEQFSASDLAQAVLLPKRSAETFLLIGITEKDLYACGQTRFIFGQSFPTWGVALISLARLPHAQPKPTEQSAQTERLRAWLRLVSHEASHAFGLPHCSKLACLMNGANNLREMNQTPLHLGPVCLLKLHHQREFDILARYHALREFYRKSGLFSEEAWVQQRTQALEKTIQPTPSSVDLPLPF